MIVVKYQIIGNIVKDIGTELFTGFSMYGLYGLPNSMRNYRDYERLD